MLINSNSLTYTAGLRTETTKWQRQGNSLLGPMKTMVLTRGKGDGVRGIGRVTGIGMLHGVYIGWIWQLLSHMEILKTERGVGAIAQR